MGRVKMIRVPSPGVARVELCRTGAACFHALYVKKIVY